MKSELTKLFSRAAGMLRHAQPTSPSAHKGRTLITLLIMLLTTATAWGAGDGTYIDEKGVQHDLNLEGIDASPIKDNGDGISNLDPDHGWYYVEGNVTINSLIGNAAGCDIHIILCDGATLNITNEDGMAISLNGCNHLYIYGQSAGNGKLIATSTGGSAINTNGGDLTIAGGIVTATSNIVGINTNGGSLTITGGYLKATSIFVGSGSITLAGGAVKASSYYVDSKEITINNGLTYYDGMGTSYESAINLNAAAVNDRILSTYEHLSGTCGNGVTWSCDLESLTISGTGAMTDYGSSSQPWNDFKQFITSVVIPDGVTRIGAGAFYGCTSLAIVSGASGVTFIGLRAFTDTAWDSNLPSGLTTLGNVAYRFVGNGTSVTIPDGTTQIYQSAFQNSAITSIVIPASVTSIGTNAFYHSALQRVYSLRPEAPELGYNAFGYCNSLGAIVVPAAAYDSYNSGWSSYSSNLQSGYTVTCDEDITATSFAPIVAEGETVTLANTATGAPSGYYNGVSVSGGTLSGNATDGWTLTMPAANVTVSSAILSTGEAVEVSYIDEDGTAKTAQAIALDNTMNNLAAGWYFVGKDVTYNGDLITDGAANSYVNIILCDGKTLAANQLAFSDNHQDNLGIFGQSQGTGTANINGTLCGNQRLTINGGIINANEIKCVTGSVAINGGTVNAGSIDSAEGVYLYGGNVIVTGNIKGYGGNVVLGGATVKAGSYTSDYGTVLITNGLIYSDGSDTYSGTLTNAQRIAIAGKTLQPVTAIDLADNADNNGLITTANGLTLDVTLKGRTLYKDGAWNTLCLPFDVADGDATDELTFSGTPLKGAIVKVLDVDGYYDGNTRYDDPAEGCKQTGLDGSTLNLYFNTATAIEAGKPYIVKWPKADGYDSAAPDTRDLKNPVFTSVTINATASTEVSFTGGKFKGTYSPVSFTANDKTKLFVGAENKLHWPNANMTLGAFRAYFQMSDGQQASAFNLNFGDNDDATGIRSLSPDPSPSREGSEEWYSLDGRKLDQQPTAKGVYIHGGRKVVIK